MLRLSVLDQVPISEGMTGREALANSVDLARLADRLGYHRFWLAEHHGLSLGSTSPEVLIGPIAAATDRVRVGSGGVMLPHYSPFKVAESFSMLAGLYPGRIDLGIGRASGTDAVTALALQRDRRTRAPDDFPEQLSELAAFLDASGEEPVATGEIPGFDAEHPFARVAGGLPGRPESPALWMLGSSPQSAVWAAELGIPYCFADFISRHGAPTVADYRDRWEQTPRDTGPRTAVGVWVICAETTREAFRLASSARMSFIKLQQGDPIPVPPPDRAIEFLGEERAMKPSRRRRTVLGDPPTVRRELEAVAAEYGTDEIIAVCILHDHEDRRRSYELLAEAFELEPSAAMSGSSA